MINYRYPWGRHINEKAVSESGGLFYCLGERPMSKTRHLMQFEGFILSLSKGPH
jgi:hypothetical protein